MTAAVSPSFNSNWLVRDGKDSHSRKRFQKLSIGSPSIGFLGKNKYFRLSGLCCSSLQNHPYGSPMEDSK